MPSSTATKWKLFAWQVTHTNEPPQLESGQGQSSCTFMSDILVLECKIFPQAWHFRTPRQQQHLALSGLGCKLLGWSIYPLEHHDQWQWAQPSGLWYQSCLQSWEPSSQFLASRLFGKASHDKVGFGGRFLAGSRPNRATIQWNIGITVGWITVSYL